jgi:TctA family transporter
MLEILAAGLAELFQPLRLSMLLAGVAIGLFVGVIPGLGGIFGLTLLVPLTYALDPVAAFALLLGMASVTTTSDTVPAVLLGVPGTVGAAATVVDGHEMAKQGRAAEALGAAYTASLIGGVFGAVALTLALPVMRPLVMLLNYGDLLAITLFGLTLVALLSGGSALRGLLAAMLGILVSLVGLDPYAGAERWTFGEVYFWGGVPTAIVFLGIFGLSELGALLGRGRVLHGAIRPEPGGLGTGVLLALRHWRLVLRSSALGSFLGAVPGIGVTVIEWLAYGSATRNRGEGPPFGQGNIRGVIAPESANNAKEGGALLPTLGFGIPGSATMAILLGAFALHGIVPGPRMLETEAPLLVVMILSVALANVVATLVCLGFTPALARIATVPARLLVPMTLVFVVMGAYYTTGQPIDIAVLVAFGVLGVAFKRLGWSRPAFALGFVLGPNIERFFVLTYQISGWSWLTQPLVLVILAVILAGGLRRLPWLRRGRAARRADVAPTRPQAEGGPATAGGITAQLDIGLALLIAAALVWMLATVWPLPFSARALPLMVLVPALGICAVIVIFGFRAIRRDRAAAWPRGRVSMRGLWVLPETGLAAYLAGVILAVLAFGHVLGPLVFVTIATALGRCASRRLAPVLGLGIAAMCWVLFDALGYRSWPDPWLMVPWP